ncbi:MAG TPA: hypothetical protein VFK86_00720, partial [Bauldia sp.]|nr:hypothetical protein [Bauldia sp.]
SAVIRESNLRIAAGPAYSATLSLKGSAAPTRQLLAACLNQPAPPAAPPPITVGVAPAGGVTARYACEYGQGFTVTYYGGQQTAVLIEPGAPPLTLRWTPEGLLGRYVAGDARLSLREEHVRWSRFGEQPRTCYPQ